MLVLFSRFEEHSSLEVKTDENKKLPLSFMPSVETIWRNEGKSTDVSQNPLLNDLKKKSKLIYFMNIIYIKIR